VYVVEIFSNIDQLWQLHQPILEEMQASVENWTDESVLASVFLNLVRNGCFPFPTWVSPNGVD